MKRLALVVTLLAGSRLAVAQPTEAERLYTEGQAAYDAKNYDGALAAWQRSYELSKLPALVFNIAQAHRLRGDCAKAIASYKKFVELDPASSERPDAEGFIKDLEPCPVIQPTLPAKPIPGPITKIGDDRGGGKRPGRNLKIAAVGAGVLGAALVVTGVVFGNKASSLAGEVDDDCGDGTCNWDDLRDKDADGRAAERNQYIFLGVGAASLATAGVLYWLGARSASTVTVTPRGDGVALAWSRRW